MTASLMSLMIESIPGLYLEGSPYSILGISNKAIADHIFLDKSRRLSVVRIGSYRVIVRVDSNS